MEIGIDPEKKLALYQTTTVRHTRDLDSDATATFRSFEALDAAGLLRFTRDADNELQGYLSGQD